MAREIDLNKPLTEAELRYLVDRDRWSDLRTNARNLGMEPPPMPNKRDIRAQTPRTGINARKREDAFEAIAKAMGVKVSDGENDSEESSSSAASSEEIGKVNYGKLTVPQLKEELYKRRAEYEKSGDSDAVEEVSYTNEDRKDDLVLKLELDDEATSAEGDTSN